MDVVAGSLASVGVGKRGLETGGQTRPFSSPTSSFRFPGGEDVANGRWLGSTDLSGSKAAMRW